MLQHFRGNLDNWDPALIDALAHGRRVITFDNRGVAASSGRTPNTIAQMALDAIDFIDALEVGEVDLLGFSIGSFVAQEIALVRPSTVRRVVLASSAPQGASGMHGWAAGRHRRRGQARDFGRGVPERLLHRLGGEPGGGTSRSSAGSSGRARSTATRPTDWQTRLAQYDAVCTWGQPNHSLLERVVGDRQARVRRQRRQRPDDPPALLLPAGRPDPRRAPEDLPGLGARLPLPAPRRVRRRRRRLPGRRMALAMTAQE